MPKAEKAEKVVKEKKAKAPPKEKKAKKEKKKKDPNAPKKPLSAYMFFCADQRDQIKKDNPEMKVTEVTSELGKVWGTLDEAAKKKFYEKAEKDKVRYKKAMEGYKPTAEKEDDGDEEEEEEEDDE